MPSSAKGAGEKGTRVPLGIDAIPGLTDTLATKADSTTVQALATQMGALPGDVNNLQEQYQSLVYGRGSVKLPRPGVMDTSNPGAGTGSVASLANKITLSPFVVRDTFTPAQLGVWVTVAGTNAGHKGRVLVFSTSPFFPFALVAVLPEVTVGTSTGSKLAANTYEFKRGNYWLGWHTDSDATFRTVADSSAQAWGIDSATGVPFKTIQRAATYSTGYSYPANWIYDETENTTASQLMFYYTYPSTTYDWDPVEDLATATYGPRNGVSYPSWVLNPDPTPISAGATNINSQLTASAAAGYDAKTINAGTYPAQAKINIPAGFCLMGAYSATPVNGTNWAKIQMTTATTGNVITLKPGTNSSIPTTLLNVELYDFGRVALDTAADASANPRTIDTTNGVYCQSNTLIQYCYVHDGSAKLVTLMGSNVKCYGNKIVNGRRYGLKITNSSNVFVENNELSGNNVGILTEPVAYDDDYDAGATKFTDTLNLLCKNNYVHDNHGTGFWSDGGNTNHTFESNLIESNDRQGIFYEISSGGIIKGNVLRDQGVAGVLVSTSSDVQVFDNLFDSNVTGMYFKLADRGPEPEKKPQNVRWYRNRVIQVLGGSGGTTNKAATFWFEPATLYSSGQNTIVANWGFTPEEALTTKGNSFIDNTYDLTASPATPFYVRGAVRTLADWKTQAGFDPAATGT